MFKKTFRIEQLRCMHEMMIQSNDEEIYMEWIEFFPDNPNESDYDILAEEDEAFNEIFDLFLKLISSKTYRI